MPVWAKVQIHGLAVACYSDFEQSIYSSSIRIMMTMKLTFFVSCARYSCLLQSHYLSQTA